MRPLEPRASNLPLCATQLSHTVHSKTFYTIPLQLPLQLFIQLPLYYKVEKSDS